MMKYTLNGTWTLRKAGDEQTVPARVPGSVYADLLDAGLMEDPYWRDNEMKALPLMEDDYEYSRSFDVPDALLSSDRVLLRCHGLDTLADIRINGQEAGHADNMHRTWEYDVRRLLHPGANSIAILFHSPTRAAEAYYEKTHTQGMVDAMRGFPGIRKAHCMYGWDWGPRLPDAGIWRDIELLGISGGRLAEVMIRQQHGPQCVTLTVHSSVERLSAQAQLQVHVTLRSPEGEVIAQAEGEDAVLEVSRPRLWWPNGLGDQPLYQVSVALWHGDTLLEEQTRCIGLRTLTIRREQDAYGESFAHVVNGVPFFAMGADYIPEDCILRRVTPERTRQLLQDAAVAHHNMIRVWGGGYYPGDEFYDQCDRLGLVVWQDLMFSCAVYDLTDAFEENIRREVADNVRRIRHHACLGLWCGNNEMEMFMQEGRLNPSPAQQSDYVKMYEYIFPKLLRTLDPDTFYWPASPSSGGGFDEPNAETRGDVHYWDVWHGNKPFTDYRKYQFRYVSEFGFQSFPCLATVERFTLPEDRNVFSYVMEKHQRDAAANGKILAYMAQMYLFPRSF
ncbi:MAG: glycoside hydrolase family 2 protein, partial [Aristaeellaceae bacterium]